MPAPQAGEVPASQLGELQPSDVDTAAQALLEGRAGAGETLIAALSGTDEALARRAWGAAVPVLRTVAAGSGDAIQDRLVGFAAARAGLEPIRDWWRSRVDDDLLARTWIRRQRFSYYDDSLAEINNARRWAGLVIESDLYLTGPPFPGPQ